MVFLLLSLQFSLATQLWLPPNPYDNGYSQERYDQVLDHFIDLYSPVIQNLGGQLYIERDWTDGAVNMWADRIGDEYWLEVPGGFSRYYLISEGAFILSVCHELGHLIGGSPSEQNISYEGQADYFATSQCLPQFLDTFEIQNGSEVDQEVTEFCDDHRCYDILSSSKKLTALYAEILSQPFPKLATPSSTVVSQTLKAHPEPQCRLDTFRAGYLGESRPVCWFKYSQ